MTSALLGDRYQLDHLIGRGGMAAVWSALDTVLQRRVAIKRLHPGMLEDEEHAERFRREARLVARLTHPNLVRLLDRGEDPEGPYLVMELVEGENLKSRIRRDGALDPDEAARICARVGEALAYAHAQGVVHRDIKAQNLLLTPDGGVKLTDFGIARLLEADEGEALTRTDMLLGSADYLSPEQADGRPVDGRADIYSLGILLWECLTGELPFRGDGFVAVAMKHCNEPLPDPRGVRAAVPGRLASVALRAAAKDPDARYQDAGALVAALDGTDEGTAVFPAPPAPPGPPIAPAVDGDDSAPPPRRRRRWRRALAWAIAAVLLAGGLAAAWAVWTHGRTAAPPAPAKVVPLTIAAVRDYDPQGDGQEHPELRQYAIDTDAQGRPDETTAWYTERYRGSPDFGGSGKTGVGLILRLTAPATATQMTVSSPTPGARFQLLGPLVDGRRDTLAEGTFAGRDQTVDLRRAAPASAYVLWITRLVPDGTGGYSAGVSQVALRGTPKTG